MAIVIAIVIVIVIIVTVIEGRAPLALAASRGADATAGVLSLFCVI